MHAHGGSVAADAMRTVSSIMRLLVALLASWGSPVFHTRTCLGQEEELEQEGEESDSDFSDSNDGGGWRGD